MATRGQTFNTRVGEIILHVELCVCVVRVRACVHEEEIKGVVETKKERASLGSSKWLTFSLSLSVRMLPASYWFLHGSLNRRSLSPWLHSFPFHSHCHSTTRGQGCLGWPAPAFRVSQRDFLTTRLWVTTIYVPEPKECRYRAAKRGAWEYSGYNFKKKILNVVYPVFDNEWERVAVVCHTQCLVVWQSLSLDFKMLDIFPSHEPVGRLYTPMEIC